MLTIEVSKLEIPPKRQRSEFTPDKIQELADSIGNLGLIAPIVVRANNDGSFHLVAGERRIMAIKILWGMGIQLRMGETLYPEGSVPCIPMGELDPIEAFEMELDENIRRMDLTWQERVSATAQLFELRRMQADRSGSPEPTISSLAAEIRGDSAYDHDTTRQELIVARHLSNPLVLAAKSVSEGFKILKREEEQKRMVRLGDSVGRYFTKSIHELHKGDCLTILPTFQPETFDVILCDPPYGMGADTFNDSGGRLNAGHFYDDSYDTWEHLVRSFVPLAYSRAKPQAHLYLFCDIDRFSELRDICAVEGFKVFRTPLIWHNPTSMRAPWPDQGPQRRYQICLYAVKGDRPVLHLKGDVLEYRSDENLGHPAQKPVALYQDLLKRSARPGDVALDAFCGSGTIFPSCHDLKIKAVGIEMDEASYGLAAKRLGELK